MTIRRGRCRIRRSGRGGGAEAGWRRKASGRRSIDAGILMMMTLMLRVLLLLLQTGTAAKHHLLLLLLEMMIWLPCYRRTAVAVAAATAKNKIRIVHILLHLDHSQQLSTRSRCARGLQQTRQGQTAGRGGGGGSRMMRLVVVG